MKRLMLALLIGASFGASAACFSIADPDARASCSAIEQRNIALCYSINDPDARQKCVRDYHMIVDARVDIVHRG